MAKAGAKRGGFLASCRASLKVLEVPKLLTFNDNETGLRFYENNPNLEEFVTANQALNLSLKK